MASFHRSGFVEHFAIAIRINIMGRVFKPAFAFFFAVLVAGYTFAQTPNADNPRPIINFKSGGLLAANILAKPQDGKRGHVVFRTDSGSVLKLDRRRVVSRLVETDNTDRHYRELLEKLSDDPDSHWELYKWCKSEGRRSRFKRQMDWHLRRIVELDPGDEKAWQLLGHVEINGRWVPEDQHLLSLGYVKSGGKWVSALQIGFDQQVAAREQMLNERKAALKKWHRHILPTADISVIRSELFKLVDPISLAFFQNTYVSREKDPEVRLLYIDAIGQVDSTVAQDLLVQYAMLDKDPEIREAAMLQLEQPLFDPDQTARLFAGYLRNSDNNVVNRAGRRIGRLNRLSSTIPLIGALRTEHVVKPGGDPGRMNIGIGNGQAGLGVGAPKPVRMKLENENVLIALERITGQRHGFDQQAWKEWYISQHTITDYGFNRDGD